MSKRSFKRKMEESMTKVDVKAEFQKEFDKLNEKQKEAVSTVEGPVMVIAGPGTGKTQILSRRVANILTNYEVDPHEIVCLTYTEAGAFEMLDRLEKLIGERGRGVRVSTIHAFCSELILSNPEQFDGQPQVISTATQFELLKEMMDKHIDEEDVLFKNSGERYSAKEQLLDLFSRMKKHDLSKETIKQEVDDYLKAIELSSPEDEKFKNFWYGKNGNKKLGKEPFSFHDVNFEKEKAKYDKLLSGSHIIKKYQEKISEQNLFDFDDMILWTIQALESNPSFQEQVAEKISYLFVDEFQDTSVVQNQIVDLLVKGEENPNLFIVGDDDQSIYRFQGVSADNVRDFEKKYNPTKIVLEENYRSSQAIIDAAKELISKNPREEKALISAGVNKDYANLKPVVTPYESEEAEMLGIMNEIQILIDKGVSPSEIGVIYGRNDYGSKFAKLLRSNGFFVQIKEKEDLFQEAFFKKILAILKYINRSHGNISELRKLLYFDFFDVSVDEIAAIRNVKASKEITSETIKAIYKKLESLRLKLSKSKKTLSPMFILQEVMRTFEIDQYVMHSKEKYRLVSIWREIYKLMEVESLMIPNLSLSGFLRSLSGLQEMKVELPIEDIAAVPENCVQLMTAHGSKGLEFIHVFMMKCNDGKKKGSEWPGGENKSGSFSYPPSLDGKEDNESQLKEEENRRLFYVAMTRAKKELHLSYNAEYPATHFLAEFDSIVEELVEVDTTDFNLGATLKVPRFSTNSLQSILFDFSLSVSSLNSYLKCPLSFYFNKGLKFPAESSEALTFGNIIHETLEGIFVTQEGDKTVLNYKTVLPKEKAIERFETIFENESWKLPSDRARRDDQARGLSIIENLYKADGYLKDGEIALEKSIEGIKLGDLTNTSVDCSEVADCTLTGKIDKIELGEDYIRLIDYKTGNAIKAVKKLEGPSEKEPLGGDYWRQAVIYYILLTNFKGLEVDITDKKILVQYVFVENTDDEKGFSTTPNIEITQSDVDIVVEQIVECLKGLKAGNFICGGDHSKDSYPCEYCTQVMLNATPEFDNTEKVEVATFEQAVKNFKAISVSSLNRFLACPATFYFDNILQLTDAAGLQLPKKEYKEKLEVKHAPTGPVFGTVIHETMEAIYQDKKQTLSLDDALVFFNNSLENHKAKINGNVMTAEEMKVNGERLLKNLFEEYIPNSCKDTQLEREFHVNLDGMPIIGIIDKLEYDGDIIRVVDYKTGFAKHGVEALEKGGDYHRQAAFYNLLLQESGEIDTDGKTIETQYVFLDDDSSQTNYSVHTVAITEDDISEVRTEIEHFWKSIRKGNVSQACQKEDCDFCRLSDEKLFNLLKEQVKLED